MNRTERAQLTAIVDVADALMNGRGNGITNADVVEALIGDVRHVANGTAPRELAELVTRDRGGDLGPIDNYADAFDPAND